MQQLRFPLHNPGIASRVGQQQHIDAPLPARRRQVLALYLSGQPRTQIAHSLGVSPHTIRNHIRIVYDDYGFTNRVQALRWALEQPVLAQEVLHHFNADGELPDAEVARQSWSETTSSENALDEAIEYFRHRAVDNPRENT